jgi:hypothetical protein
VRARAGFGMMDMTLLQLRHDDRRSFAGDGRVTFARAFRRLRAACRLMHRAIITARTRRLQSELMFFHARDCGEPSPGEDATRYPQRPMILGDKWDF